MTDTLMLLVSLAAFAVLVVGWMILPDDSSAKSVEAPAAPARAARAA